MKSFPNKVVWFCRIVGGLPVKCISGTGGIKALKFSVAGFLWNSTLVVLQELLLLALLYNYFMNKQNVQSKNRTTDVAVAVHMNSLQIMVAVVFLSSSLKYQRLVDVFDILERIYRNLQLQTTGIRVKVIYLGISIASIISVIVAEPSVTHDDNEVRRRLGRALSFPSMLLVFFSQAALFVHYTIVTQGITKSFRMVKSRIEKEFILDIIEREERNHGLLYVEAIYIPRTMPMKMRILQNLTNTYWNLCDAVHQANVFYCDQLMAVMFSSFVHVTITSYYIFLYAVDGNVFKFATKGAWILTHIYYLVHLVNSSTDVTNSADETGQMFCKLNIKDLDPASRKQLEDFLLQLPHRKVSFSAVGFFPIHNKVLPAMAGAVATYLVILIQFQIEQKSI
ncbi:gustatory receptor [Homalodisca vitripennis]|nr:gustatory receptor [Homalodisca vitripennis]